MLTENAALALGMTRVESALRRRVDAALHAQHGLSFTDFLVLAELAGVRGGRLRTVDLAQRLVLSPSGVTRAVAPLAERGFVERAAHERDARGHYVVLRETGRRAFDTALPTVERTAADALGTAMTRADRIAVLGLFERLGY